MKILVINCGSSSLKYQLIDMKDESVLAIGNYERVGQYNSFLTHKVNNEKYLIETPVKNHEEALNIIVTQLLETEYAVIKSLEEIDGVGHRVVHGGETFTSSVIIDETVLKGIKDVVDLAPLHNPAGIIGINACKKAMPNVKMVAVFDTAFHQTMPEKAYTYPIPNEYYDKYKVRKYGFHGTSHKFISQRIAELLNKDIKTLKVISCHLGQGASLCAIDGGLSVDTSMGLTPLAGIPMGSRSGDIDPSIVTFLMKKENLTAEEVEDILNKKSGVFGVSGISPDFRDIEDAESKGDKKAKLALDNYAYLVAQYIGRYAVSMNGVDVITFTAGVGENGIDTRKRICEYLTFLGVDFDNNANNTRGKDAEISKKDSKVKVYVVPTNEEVMIARDTVELIK